MYLAMLSHGPINGAIGSLSEFFGKFVGALSGGLDPSTSKWLVDQSIYFQLTGLAVLMVKFYVDIVHENRQRKGAERILGLGSAITHLGFRLFWIPLIMFASAIPGVFQRMTPSAFSATTSTAREVAGVGDGLVDKVGEYWSMTVRGGARQVLAMTEDDGAKLTPDQRSAALQTQQSYGLAATRLEGAKSVYEGAIASGAGKAEVLKLKRSLDLAQSQFTGVNNELVRFSATIAPRLDPEGKPQIIEKAQADLKILRAMNPNETVGTKGYGEDREPLTAKEKIGRIEQQVAEASKPQTKTFSGWDIPGALADFIGSIGFYACCLPALLGIAAGAVIALKEALGIMQFGAKIDVMKGLGLTFAAFFAPIFMLAFLFSKTEQFGWKFVSFLFSVYFGVYGITYGCGVVANIGFKALSGTVTNLVAVPTGYLAKEASQALFTSSLGIGLTALGVGLVTAFASDIVKSALSVGQGPFNGNFHA